MNAPEPTVYSTPPQNHNDSSFEPSAWLQRHARGLVQWHPWSPAALAAARTLDRPLLLVLASEGCLPFEQMAEESFADPGTAAVMNDGYLCCLADARWHRELDRQLQLVHQLLAGRAGGWPLLALIDPVDARPCFAGTFFPAQPMGSLPGFADFLRQALRHFHGQRAALQEQGERLAKAFRQLVPPALPVTAALTTAPLGLVRRQLEALFDRETGAFTRGAPVPAGTAALRLLRHWTQGAATPEPDLHALFMATLALTRASEAAAPSPTSTAGASQSADLAAFAAAAAATGDPAFRLAAEQTYAALAALGAPDASALPAVENWQRIRAMALAARWLDRPDWTETTEQHFAVAAAAPLGSASDHGAALATALAVLELQWSDSVFTLAYERAVGLSQALANAAPSPLPGLPAIPAHADDTLPSADGMAALALYRLGCLCGDTHWQATAATVLRGAWRPMNDSPATHFALLDALEEQVLGLETIVIRGVPAEAARWARALGRWYAPARQVFAIPAGATGLPPRLATLLPIADTATSTVAAWVFTGDAPPSHSDSLEQLTRELRDRLRRG